MTTLVATDGVYRMAEHASAHDDVHSPSPQVGGCSPMAWLRMQVLMTTPTLLPHRWEAARLWHGYAARLDEISNGRVLLVPGDDLELHADCMLIAC